MSRKQRVILISIIAIIVLPALVIYSLNKWEEITIPGIIFFVLCALCFLALIVILLYYITLPITLPLLELLEGRRKKKISSMFPLAYKVYIENERYIEPTRDDIPKLMTSRISKWAEFEKVLQKEKEMIDEIKNKYPLGYDKFVKKYGSKTRNSLNRLNRFFPNYLYYTYEANPEEIIKNKKKIIVYDEEERLRIQEEEDKAKQRADDIRSKYPLGIAKFLKVRGGKAGNIAIVNNKDIIRRYQEEDKAKQRADDIRSKYPLGMAKFLKEHDGKESDAVIVANKEKIRQCEKDEHLAKYYATWINSQVDFSRKCRELRDEILSTWGCYKYKLKFPVDTKSEFQVWQFFCNSFCDDDDLDYSLYPFAKDNALDNAKLISKGIGYKDCIYDKIVEFVVRLKEEFGEDGNRVIIRYGNSDFEEYKELNDYHFDYLQTKIKEAGFGNKRVDIKPKDKIYLEERARVVIIDLITSNDILKDNCQRMIDSMNELILKKCDKLDFKCDLFVDIVYISLSKGFDRNEMISILDRKEKEKEEVEKARAKAEEIRSKYPLGAAKFLREYGGEVGNAVIVDNEDKIRRYNEEEMLKKQQEEEKIQKEREILLQEKERIREELELQRKRLEEIEQMLIPQGDNACSDGQHDYFLPDKYSRDEHQSEVILLAHGHNLVLAPPGCGKTDILAERIVRAHSCGIRFEDMLCLTFTNRAARGMRERIESRLAQMGIASDGSLFVGNLHRFCAQFLYKNGYISQTSSIIDEKDSYNIIRVLNKKMESDDELEYNEKNDLNTLIELQHIFSQIRHGHPKEIWLKSDYFEYCYEDLIDGILVENGDFSKVVDFYDNILSVDTEQLSSNLDCMAYVFKLAKKYENYKRQNDLIDFDDLLIKAYNILRTGDASIKRYPWIQVDEVQDLNRLQLALVDLLSGTSGNSVIVYLGDEQQAIFSFIGAQLGTLDYLKAKCGGTVYRLYKNYRSPKYLLDVFNHYAATLLDVDPALLPRTDRVVATDGTELRILSGVNSTDELSKAVNTAIEITHENERTVILVSSNKDADKISCSFGSTEHFKISGCDLFSEPLVQTILAHLSVVHSERNFVAWSRILRNFKIFDSYMEAREFLNKMDKCLLMPTDFLNKGREGYIASFVRDYQSEIVIFDTETTGLDIFTDDIVQIAAIKLRNGIVVENFNIMLHTDKPIPAKLGDKPNPLVREYASTEHFSRQQGLIRFLGFVSACPVLGHNVNFDMRILDYNLRRDCGINSLRSIVKASYDTLKIFRTVKSGLNSYKLKDLLTALNLEGNNSHLAQDDILATKSLADFAFGISASVVPEQEVFISNNRYTIEKFASVYKKYYEHTTGILYDKGKSARSALVEEMSCIYHMLIDDGLFGPHKKFRYVEDFLDLAVVDKEKTPTLYEQLNTHIMELSTFKEADLCGAEDKDGNMIIKDKYFISTIHKAKGLEFDNVIVVSVNEGLFPFYATQNNPICVKEDARKLYVAMSRAKKRLILYHHLRNQGTSKWGQPYDHPCEISPFVHCIEQFFTRE